METKCTVKEFKELLNKKTPVAGTTDVELVAKNINGIIRLRSLV